MDFSQFVNEGIRLGINQKPEIDFNRDSPDDLIRLVSAPIAGSNSYKVEGSTIKMYHGYAMENAEGSQKVQLMDALKKPDTITDDELVKLIKLTYPDKLISQRVDVIIPAGSSSPLALRIAEAVKNIYYPNAKVIDVVKRFYADPLSIVNWEAYAKADMTTRKQLDSYLKNHVVGYWNGPAAMNWANQTGKPVQDWPGIENAKTSPDTDWTGFIKKSAGLRSGSRRLLNVGHHVDDYIIDAFKSADKVHRDLISSISYNRLGNFIKQQPPHFMIVDDMVIGGTTLKGIVNDITSKLNDANLNEYIKYISTYSLIKYSKSNQYTEKSISKSEEPVESTKAKQAEITSRGLRLFMDANNAARGSKLDLDQTIKKLVDSENQKDLAKPKGDRANFTVDLIKTIAKKNKLIS
jgi:hypothetical protein